jgi:hypothetical protein
MEKSLDPRKPPVRWSRFWGDMLVSACLSGIPIMILALAFADDGPASPIALVFALAFGVVMHFVPGLLFATFASAPIVAMFYGIYRRRPGFIVGPVLLGAALAAMLLDSSRSQDAMVEGLVAPELAAAIRTYPMLAVDGPGCDFACLSDISKVIATTNSAFAVRASDGKWTVSRRADGAACNADANAVSALNFIRDGYVGLCAVETTEQQIGDALIYRKREVSDSRPAEDLVTFRGAVSEVLERIDGREYLLARHLRGHHVRMMPGVFVLIDSAAVERAIDKGQPLDRERVIAWALQIPIEQLKAPGPAPLPTRLDTAESYLDRPAFSRDARRVWNDIASRAGDQPEILPPRIERFLAGHEPLRAEAALDALRHITAPLPGEHGAVLLRLLHEHLSAEEAEVPRNQVETGVLRRLISRFEPSS